MITTVGVVGAGQMGSGIAQVCARAGYVTRVVDAAPEALERGLARIAASLERGVQRERIAPADRDAALAHLRSGTGLDDLADCDLVIEAAVEVFDVKRDIFARLDAICPPHTIFATNTSSLSIVELAVTTGRRDRFLGLHFFNPVPTMNVVEVVRSITVAAEVIEEVTSFVESLGKRALQAKDTPGFIVNRLLVPFLLDAIRAYENGVAARGDIDAGFVLGCNFPMGPLALADFIGLDVVFHIAESLYREFHEPRYSPPVMLKQLYLAGMLGQKSGRGFYDYARESPPSGH